eukprot:4121244-Alexandrium_andersonii.AAC.1
MDGPHRARGLAQVGVALPAGAAGAGHAHRGGDDRRGVRCRGRRRAQGRARPVRERGPGAQLPAAE